MSSTSARRRRGATDRSARRHASRHHRRGLSEALCCLTCTPFAAHQRLRLQRFDTDECGECALVADEQANAQFGSRVVMSKDGSVLVVAAPLYDVVVATGGETNDNGGVGDDDSDIDVVANNGAVFVYERAAPTSCARTSSRCGDKPKWLFRQRLVQRVPPRCVKELQTGATDETAFNFGQSVAVSEDGFYIVVGAPLQRDGGDDGDNCDDDGAGAVYVYARCPKRKSFWVPVQKLVAQRFAEVPVCDDHNDGEDDDGDDDDGDHDDGDAHCCTKCALVSDAGAGDLFGYSVDISRDGGTIIVGAPFNGDGAAYVYRRDCTIGLSNVKATFQRRCTSTPLYALVQKLERPPASTTPGVGAGSMFGFAVALSGFGDVAAVGKPSLDLAGNPSFPAAGAVCIFESSCHAHYDFVEQVRAAAPDDVQAGALFGTAVRLTPDKRFLLVEASGEEKQVTFSGGGSMEQRAGSVYVFERQRANADGSGDGGRCCKAQRYVQVAKLCPDFADTDVTFVQNALDEMTSFDVSDNGCVIAVGYETVKDGASFDGDYEGAVLVFRYDKCTNGWRQRELLRPFTEKRLRPDTRREGAAFGASVSLNGVGTCLVVGEATGLEDVTEQQRAQTFAYSYASVCGRYAVVDAAASRNTVAAHRSRRRRSFASGTKQVAVCDCRRTH